MARENFRARDALTEDERARVEDAIHDVGRIVYRR
jgi:hypothetical protein